MPSPSLSARESPNHGDHRLGDTLRANDVPATPMILEWATAGWRLVLIAVALGTCFWTQRVIGRQSARSEGIGDGIHELTAKWHAYFVNHGLGVFKNAGGMAFRSHALRDLIDER